MGGRRPNGKDVLIRNAKASDLSVLVDFQAKLALHVAGAPIQKLKENERKRLLSLLSGALADSDKLLVVAELLGAGLVGMAYISIWRSHSIWEQAGDQRFSSGIIDDIWVEPAFRKLGIFTAMLKELIAFAERKQVPELVLEYAITNKEADATWKRLGFKVTGVRAAAFTSAVRNTLGASASVVKPHTKGGA